MCLMVIGGFWERELRLILASAGLGGPIISKEPATSWTIPEHKARAQKYRYAAFPDFPFINSSDATF
jgi:hypothetical protein